MNDQRRYCFLQETPVYESDKTNGDIRVVNLLVKLE